MCKGPGASSEHGRNCKPETGVLGTPTPWRGSRDQSREVSRKQKDTASKAWLRSLGYTHEDERFGAGRVNVSWNPGMAGIGR